MKVKIALNALTLLLLLILAACRSNNDSVNLSDLLAEDIISFTVTARPPDVSKKINDNIFIAELAAILRTVETYEEDNSYSQYFGQWVDFDLTLKSGKNIIIAAYNPFIIINGTGYKTKYEPCQELNQFANNLLGTDWAE